MTTEAPPRRSRRPMLLLGAGLTVVAVGIAGLITVRAIQASETELPHDLCANVVAALPQDAVSSIRTKKPQLNDVSDHWQVAQCTLTWSEDTLLVVSVTRHRGPHADATKWAREEYDKETKVMESDEEWKPIPNLGDEASGAVWSGGEVAPDAVKAAAYVREGRDLIHLRHIARPATTTDTQNTLFRVARGLSRTL